MGGDTGAPMCYTFGRTDCIAQPRCSWELALQKCLVRDDVADGGGATGGGGADGLIEEDDDTDGECGGLTDRNQCGRNGACVSVCSCTIATQILRRAFLSIFVSVVNTVLVVYALSGSIYDQADHWSAQVFMALL